MKAGKHSGITRAMCTMAVAVYMALSALAQGADNLPDDPKGLYKKGDCKSLGVGGQSCVYCTDKELTNCAEYWCSGDKCSKAPKLNAGSAHIAGLIPAGAKELKVTGDAGSGVGVEYIKDGKRFLIRVVNGECVTSEIQPKKPLPKAAPAKAGAVAP